MEEEQFLMDITPSSSQSAQSNVSSQSSVSTLVNEPDTEPESDDDPDVYARMRQDERHITVNVGVQVNTETRTHLAVPVIQANEGTNFNLELQQFRFIKKNCFLFKNLNRFFLNYLKTKRNDFPGLIRNVVQQEINNRLEMGQNLGILDRQRRLFMDEICPIMREILRVLKLIADIIFVLWIITAFFSVLFGYIQVKQ